jgi:hypothetical protein
MSVLVVVSVHQRFIGAGVQTGANATYRIGIWHIYLHGKLRPLRLFSVKTTAENYLRQCKPQLPPAHAPWRCGNAMIISEHV